MKWENEQLEGVGSENEPAVGELGDGRWATREGKRGLGNRG